MNKALGPVTSTTPQCGEKDMQQLTGMCVCVCVKMKEVGCDCEKDE